MVSSNKKRKQKDYNSSNINPHFHQFLSSHPRAIANLRTKKKDPKATFVYLGKEYEAWFEDVEQDVYFAVHPLNFPYRIDKQELTKLINTKPKISTQQTPREYNEQMQHWGLFGEALVKNGPEKSENDFLLTIKITEIPLGPKGHLSENLYKEAFRRTLSRLEKYTKTI